MSTPKTNEERIDELLTTYQNIQSTKPSNSKEEIWLEEEYRKVVCELEELGYNLW